MRAAHGALLVLASLASGVPVGAAELGGTAVDSAGAPLPGSRVRVASPGETGQLVRAREAVRTAEDGRFSVEAPAAERVLLGVGRPGYFNTVVLTGVTGDVELGDVELEALPFFDFPGYAWIPPSLPIEGAEPAEAGCNYCHGAYERDTRDSLMSEAARDPYVLGLYAGTDLDGEAAAVGYRLDRPAEAGPCADCHAPAAAVDAPGGTVLTDVDGVAADGVFCDVCHKVAAVDTDAGPGVNGSVTLWRPSPLVGRFCFGPFEDGGGRGPMLSSFSDLLTRSRHCAGCHEWTNEHGVPVLSTYTEWSEMAGADPDALHCQDCHMKKRFGADYRGEPDPTTAAVLERHEMNGHLYDNHAVLRWSDTLYPHRFEGALEFAGEAARLDARARQEHDVLSVDVTVENSTAGHALPTGQPFRNVLLVVEVDAEGRPAEQIAGPVVPAWGGGGARMAHLAGLPGTGFARVLGDGSGRRNVPFWVATEVVEDTRIRPGESALSAYRFALPPGAEQATVRTRLIYRRAFAALDAAMGWDFEDVPMAAIEVRVELQPVAAGLEGCGCAPVSTGVRPGLAVGLLRSLAGRRAER